jgi:hypothetical protein
MAHHLPRLATAADLFHKAESDLKALEASQSDSFLAFNLFVTLEHLPDWLGLRAEVKQKAELRIVSHLANGSKHFTVDPNRHRSVEDTSVEGYGDNYVDKDYEKERLTIHLSLDELPWIGDDRIDAVELARLVIDFWRPKVGAVPAAR